MAVQVRLLPLALSVSLALIGAACSPTIAQRGHPPLAEMQAALTPEVKTKDDVMRVLGSPSTTSDFGALTWYYISAERESYAFTAPSTTRQDVLRIVFNEDGTIKETTSADLSDAKKVDVSSRITPTEGHELGFVEQVMSNVGRFNGSDKKNTGPHTLGRPGGI